jgi:RNA 3'-terminal phosphate cyclase (ATP)
MLTIDGSMGEGGGQILRSALALAMATGTPVRITEIRAKRSKPGLLRQHLTAARAIEALGARVEGAELGSGELCLEPDSVRGGEHHFAIGSAGSACLVLQTVLPVLLASGESARLVLEGGTHNPWAPPLDFIDRVFLPLLARMGAGVRVVQERRGFYPAGGGRFVVEVDACRALAPLSILDRGPIVERRATSIVANAPGSVAVRELAEVSKQIGWEEGECEIVQDASSPGPGNALMLEVSDGNIREMSTAFGERGVRAGTVARRAIKRSVSTWTRTGPSVSSLPIS